jgi:hypothetical protein
MMKQKWHLLGTTYWPSAVYWVRDIGSESYWMNMVGGMIPKGKSDTILDTKIVESYDDLDWSVTGYLVTDTVCGWLSPEGKWYGCTNENHDLIADLILKRSRRELDRAGWVKVYGRKSNSPGGYSWECERRLTPEQRNWLSYEGHTVRDSD